MAKIGFLLRTGPYQHQNYDTVYNLAKAALEKGHQVQIFMYLDGVYNLIKFQKFSEMSILPKDKFTELVQMRAKILACGTCTNARGLENGRDFIGGVKVGGMPDFAEMLGDVDRFVAL